MSDECVVALYTFGSFHGWATDPLSPEDAEAFVSNPPECWAPRTQDRLVIFDLREAEQGSPDPDPDSWEWLGTDR